MVYLSLSARILLNIEALNMTESTGYYVKHRRAPIVIPVDNGYILRYVPVISGESIAHAYQEILAKIASETSLPVCRLCRQGIFLKHTDKNVFKESGIPAPQKLDNAVVVEEAIVKHCTVEDVGGFLYTDATLKRTSRFLSGYMIPALDTIKSSAAEAQFHVRYDPRSPKAQSIYNIEAGSALYILNAALDIDGIGVSSIVLDGDKPKLLIDPSERIKRIEASFKALQILVTQQLFGAKRTRFMPQWSIMSIALLISHPLPLNIMPAHNTAYIKDAVESLKEAVELLGKGSTPIDEKVFLYYYSRESIEEPSDANKLVVEKVSSPTQVFSRAHDTLLKLVRGG